MAWSNGGQGSNIPERSKRIVRRRQGNACNTIDPAVCTGQIEEFDHVVNLATLKIPRNRANDPGLLQGLCHKCHVLKTAREAAEGKRRKRFRQPLQHPGLVDRKNILSDMVAEAAQDDSYRLTNGFVETRQEKD